MKYLAKILTALRLLVTGDRTALKQALRTNLAGWRLRRARGRPLIYHDFGFPMICHLDWPDSVGCFAHDAANEWESRLIRRWLEPGETAFDFGANLGVYTFAAAAAVGINGRVVSVDADAFVVEKLHAGAALLATPQVTPVHRAITTENGTVTFYVRANRSDTGGQSLQPEEADRLSCTAVTVPTSTVPGLLADLNLTTMPALVKVDIEGAEGMLLATVPPAWLGAEGPLWITEVNPFALKNFGLTARAITDRFPAEHFECWLLAKHPLDPGRAPWLEQLTSDTVFTSARYYNFFALPRAAGRRDRVRRLAGFFRDSSLTRPA